MEGLYTGATIRVVGYLGGEPEMSFTPKGKAVTKLSIGVGQKEKGTSCFYRCTIWEKDAELVNEAGLSKGTPVVVVGRYNPKSYDTKKGESRVSHDITVSIIGVFKSSDVIEWIELKGGSKKGSDDGGVSDEALQKIQSR